MTTIYHTPRCSKSRATLALIRDRGIEPDVVLYLENPPGREAIRSFAEKMGCPILEIIRTGDNLYKELDLGTNPDEESLLDALTAHPSLLQRPIVIHNGKAALGRPPENVLSVL